jgi:hypothetical protein
VTGVAGVRSAFLSDGLETVSGGLQAVFVVGRLVPLHNLLKLSVGLTARLGLLNFRSQRGRVSTGLFDLIDFLPGGRKITLPQVAFDTSPKIGNLLFVLLLLPQAVYFAFYGLAQLLGFRLSRPRQLNDLAESIFARANKASSCLRCGMTWS